MAYIKRGSRPTQRETTTSAVTNLLLPCSRADGRSNTYLITVAFLAGAEGLRSDQVAVVSVIISLFSAVTVLLAWGVLRERLRSSQWIGVGVILVGVSLVSV